MPYRFVFSADWLDALLARYENRRRLAGIGTTLLHVSPRQRLDAIAVMLGLNELGWEPIAGENAEHLWLRYMTPVLAETREAAIALSKAVTGLIAGRFESAVGGTSETTKAIKQDVIRPPKQGVGRPCRICERARRALEETRYFFRGSRGVAALLLLTAVAGAVYAGTVYWQAWKNDGDAAGIDLVVTLTRDPPDTGGDVADPPLPADSDFTDGAHRLAMQVTLAAARYRGGVITPRELAQIYAGESDMVSEPAIFLHAMLEEWPLPPDAAVAHNPAGAWALQRYAAVFVAIEEGADKLPDTLRLDRGSDYDQFLQGQIDQFTKPELGTGPAKVVAAATWPGWLPWLAFLPLLPLAAWCVATFVPAVKAALVEAARKARGVEASLPVDRMAKEIALSPARRVARQISWRERVPGRRLHAERSIRATLEHGGFLVPVRRLVQRRADYVFLVPKWGRGDHEHDRASRLIDALKRGGVPIDVYDYDPDPRWLTPRRADGDADPSWKTEGKDGGRPKIGLRGLRELHADARLVLVTDGTELVNYLDQRPHDFVGEELATWPKRMLLTPVPVGEWGAREMNLADALGAPIGRATAQGFLDLSKAFGEHSRHAPNAPKPLAGGGAAKVIERLSGWLAENVIASSGRNSLPVRPGFLRFEDPMLTSDAAPPAEERAALVVGLRHWLGPLGFQWLAACAAYPQLRFAITLYLGLNIQVSVAGETPQRLYDERRLTQLALLPWFRIGRMPPWLRHTLFEALPEAARKRARNAIDKMLHERAEPASTTVKVWRPDPRGLDMPPDAVMADIMMRDLSDLTPVLRGQTFANLFGRPLLYAALRRLELLGATAAWCAGAWWFWPAPAAAPHPNGAWLPLAVYLAITLGVVVFLAAGRGMLRRMAG